MDRVKTKSLSNIEERMQGLDENSLRYSVLGSVKSFKTSWIELGQTLYSVWKDKLYKGWGYQNFDTYTAKELGIRKQTAMKLLRSYYFLEKEEPAYLSSGYLDSADAKTVPTYESIDVLRLAKAKKVLDSDDYTDIKKKIFEKGKDAREIKKELTALIRQRQELSPDEARQNRKLASVKRCISVLKSLKRDLEEAKLVSVPILKEIETLIGRLDSEIA